MMCQILFSRKYITNLLSVDSAHSVVSVNVIAEIRYMYWHVITAADGILRTYIFYSSDVFLRKKAGHFM